MTTQITICTATYTFSTTSPVEAAAVAEIFTGTRQSGEIVDFTVEKSTFGDGVHISTECTPTTARVLDAEIAEAQRRIGRFGTTAIG